MQDWIARQASPVCPSAGESLTRHTEDHLDYVAWVEHVARTVAALTAESGWVVRPAAVLASNEVAGESEMAVYDAIEDLVAIGVIEDRTNQNYIGDNQSLRAMRQGASLTGSWPSFMGQWLDEKQSAFLVQAVGVCERREEGFAALAWTTAEDMFAELGWPVEGHDPLHLAQSLQRLGYVQVQAAIGGPVRVRPTYRGVVRATRRVVTEWQQRLREMVDEWETTTVEFKSELSLGTPARNAEFAHDVMALANTKASGSERYLILGYHPNTREFTTPASPTVSQDRIEDVLNEYSDPQPAIRYFTLDHESGRGPLGILEVHRDPALVPHRIKREAGKRHTGDVYVRHGSHIEKPTAEELAALIAEGERARVESLPRTD